MQWFQLSKKIVGKQTRVGIVVEVGSTVSFNLLYWFNRSGSRFWFNRRWWRYNLRRLIFLLLFLLWIFKLFTDSHTLTCPYELGEIGVKGMVRKTCQFYTVGFAVATSGQGYFQYLRRFDGINAHTLIEISYTEKENGIGMFLLHFPILLHQRGIRYALWLFYLVFGRTLNRLRCWRC